MGRKGVPTQNMMAACDFDLLFTFVMTEWEGAAHDMRIFLDSIRKNSINFPKPPPVFYILYILGYFYACISFIYFLSRKILFG